MNQDSKRYLENWYDEKNSAALYTKLAEHEQDSRLSEVYRRLAATEETHAEGWAKKLQQAGGSVPTFTPTWRTRTLAWLASKFGVEAVLPTLAATEKANSNGYASQPDAAALVPVERSHAMLLQQMSKTSGGVAGDVLAKMEGRHRSAGGNALRAAVLGASDGLVSNFNLVMGVAGASLSNSGILLTGFAGLLAGAISMALGEWISVQSSRELYERQIATEKEEIATAPEEEIEELALIYQARGLDETSARSIAQALMANPETALDTLARDELGINPEDLGGSAWEAAITSFLLFAAGAIIPIIPYLFSEGMFAVIVSAALSAVGLFVIGAAITLFTGKPVFSSGMRQVLFGLAAAAVTYLIGHLIGVNIAG
ncbi:rubrerythrin family protein [Anaerosporomusa subterranea]|uniref:Rubrerythrin family protein n=1 Tax=Anaerosporomusa subterranea TaxID=1794912 RepID=A0A154BMB9_ANASB|nr:VIT1/CCC1 transporter family protein [Anaerosporomusa subterranea]KYZ75066.1 rubrerythrin family protein [Anaerosporomusa subterranea]